MVILYNYLESNITDCMNIVKNFSRYYLKVQYKYTLLSFCSTFSSYYLINALMRGTVNR